MTSNNAFRECLLEMIKIDNFSHFQPNLFQFSSSWHLELILRVINFRQFLQKYFSRNKFVQNSRHLRNFLSAKFSPLTVVYQLHSHEVVIVFQWVSSLWWLIQQGGIFSLYCFFSSFPSSHLDFSLPLFLVLIIILFVYILTLLVSNKPVAKHKFENKIS